MPSKTSKDIKFNANSLDWSWLHPWYPAPIIYEEILYKAALHYYCVHHVERKSSTFKKIHHHYDPQKWLYLASKKGAGEDYVLMDRQQEYDLMMKANKLKFSNNPLLARLLLETGDSTLIYDAEWDSVFGSGKNGKGENQLGRLLMEVRKKLMRKPSLVRIWDFEGVTK